MRTLLLALGLGGPLFLSGCGDCYDNDHPGSCGIQDPGTDDSPDTTDDSAPPGACEQAREAAETVLESYCYACHGQNGRVEGGMNYVLDVPTMVAKGKVVPGNAAGSILYQRMSSATMPPSGSDAPSPDEVEAVRVWIDACTGIDEAAPETNLDFNAPIERTFLPLDAVLGVIADDIRSVPAADQAYTRYLSLVHLYNDNLPEDQLNTYRLGLSKLINHMSWGEAITVPTSIPLPESVKTAYAVQETDRDGDGAISAAEQMILLYRIDLRDYNWDAQSRSDKIDAWEYLIALYPYAFDYSRNSVRYPDFSYIQETTGSRLPLLNADWVVRQASVPPLYHEILELPDTSAAFFERFGVDVQEELEQRNVVRSGFLRSGVSNYNRLMERIDALYGYCWNSYDFGGEVGDQSLYNNPLPGFENDPDPEVAAAAAEYDGGEMFCTLPNGTQAYLLAKSNGERLDVGPTTIVLDPLSIDPGSAVINGLSCMNCHYAGIIPKDDELREQVLGAGQNQYPQAVRTIVDAIHPENRAADQSCPPGSDYFCAIQQADRDAFAAVMEEAAIPAVLENSASDFDNIEDGDPLTQFIVEGEPTYQLARAFDDYLSIDQSAAELWLDQAQIGQLFPGDMPDPLKEKVTGLVTGSEISRDQFLSVSQDLLCFYHGTGAATFDDGAGACVPEADACGVSGVACLSGQRCAQKIYVRSEIGGRNGEQIILDVCVEERFCAASETCGDRFDNDCDGVADDGCP